MERTLIDCEKILAILAEREFDRELASYLIRKSASYFSSMKHQKQRLIKNKTVDAITRRLNIMPEEYVIRRGRDFKEYTPPKNRTYAKYKFNADKLKAAIKRKQGILSQISEELGYSAQWLACLLMRKQHKIPHALVDHLKQQYDIDPSEYLEESVNL